MFAIEPKARRQQIDRATAVALDGWQSRANETDPAMLLEAVLAIGCRRTYGLRCARWKPVAGTLTDAQLSLHVQAVSRLVEECTERLSGSASGPHNQSRLVAMIIDRADRFGSRGDSASRPLRLVRDRMDVMFGVQGLEWLFAERSHADRSADLGSGHEPLEPVAEQAYGKLAVRINAYDQTLEEKIFSLSLYEVARGNELAAMRAFIPATHFLPWWLDGTFEALCLACEYCWSSWDQLATTLQVHGSGRMFRQALLESLDGHGPEVQRLSSRPSKQKPLSHRYAWRLADHEAPAARVELLVTWIGSRVPTLEFRLDRESEHELGPSVVGSMMILNGLPIRWLWTATKGLYASFKPSEFPTTGDLVLADCRSYQILQPVAPQPGWFSQFEPHG
jgi:hypothetical protein